MLKKKKRVTDIKDAGRDDRLEVGMGKLSVRDIEVGESN